MTDLKLLKVCSNCCISVLYVVGTLFSNGAPRSAWVELRCFCIALITVGE